MQRNAGRLSPLPRMGSTSARTIPYRGSRTPPDWLSFLELKTSASALGAEFTRRHVLPNDAAADILTHIAAHAAPVPAPKSALHRFKTDLVRAAQVLSPPLPDLYPRHWQGGLATSPRHYQRWIAAYDSPSSDELDALRAAPKARVSVIIESRDATPAESARTEASLRCQTLPPHEILHAGVSDDLATVAAGANAELLCIVTSGDALAPHALTTLVTALRDAPQAPFAYSDEDWLDANGQRQNPYFRPDWSPDLFLAQGYAAGLTLMRTADLARGARDAP